HPDDLLLSSSSTTSPTPSPTPFPYTTLFRSQYPDRSHPPGGELAVPVFKLCWKTLRRRSDIFAKNILLFQQEQCAAGAGHDVEADRKSTRLNSSHVSISYAVFCLKKKKKNTQ